MKREEKDQARMLRRQAKSIKEIARVLGVSKASVSLWVRDISLTSKQRKGLTARGFSIDVVEKRRATRIRNTLKRHQQVTDAAKDQIDALSKRDLLLMGSALYWGEGAKTKRGQASIANGDPRIIKIMMRFFREVCGVPDTKFRGHIHTFSHLNTRRAEQYWSRVSGIPVRQFYKTYAKPSKASQGKKDSLPYGTFDISVPDTRVFLTVMGWIEKMDELVNQ